MYKFLLPPPRADAGYAHRRTGPRAPVYTEAAVVTAPEIGTPLTCAVRDISGKGARLEIDRERPSRTQLIALPDHVTVKFGPREKEAICRVTWQHGAHFGVEFLEPLHGHQHA